MAGSSRRQKSLVSQLFESERLKLQKRRNRILEKRISSPAHRLQSARWQWLRESIQAPQLPVSKFTIMSGIQEKNSETLKGIEELLTRNPQEVDPESLKTILSGFESDVNTDVLEQALQALGTAVGKDSTKIR